MIHVLFMFCRYGRTEHSNIETKQIREVSKVISTPVLGHFMVPKSPLRFRLATWQDYEAPLRQVYNWLTTFLIFCSETYLLSK